MNPTRTCPKCAAPLPADAPAGHCPQCLLSLTLAAQPGPATAAALEQATLDSGTAAAAESRASGTGTVRLNSPTEKPGDTIGRYKLLQKVGEGGCGTVYMAEQSEPVRRKVALKVIKLGMDTKAVIARFDAERQALAMMDHPNIAKVLDAGATDAGRPYFVMELVRGIPITKYCDENQLDTPARLGLFTAVCSAIQHAHQKGIIHRDIKPSNILVTLHDGVPVPKVIDFGIAKATEARLTDLTLFTELHAFVGTPAYMSPEQAEMSGLDMDTRADIYSLGVLLYELLSGKLPFDPETLLKAGLDEMRRTIREVEPPRPSTRLSTMTGGDLTAIAKHRSTEAAKLSTLLRGDLDWIVMKALEKDRTRRYESASAFAQDIKRYLGNEAVLACPPSAAYLLQKLVRRHRLAFAAGAAVAASLVIGLSVSTWLFFKERAAQGRAKAEAEKSNQVATFMKDMLKGVGPSVALGRDATMLREIVDKTAERLGKDLKDQPEVEASLCSVIGNAYYDLTDFDRAKTMHQRALEIRRRILGEVHLDVATSLSELSKPLSPLNELPKAETLLREALAIRRKLLRAPHADVARSQAELARCLWMEALDPKRADPVKEAEVELLRGQAVTEFRQVIEALEKGKGRDNLDVSAIRLELAGVLWGMGERQEVELIHREVLAIRRKLLGAEHPDVAESLDRFGRFLMTMNKLPEAEQILREAQQIFRRLPGSERRKAADTLHILGFVLDRQRKWPEAEATYREALTMKRELFGGDNPRLLETLESLGLLLERQGRSAEAEPLYRESLPLWDKLLGKDHRNVAEPYLNLGGLLARQGKLDEAEQVYREVVARERKQGEVAPRVLNTLGSLLHRQGKFGEAEQVFRESLVIHQKSSPDDWQRFYTESLIGAALLDQKQLAEAEQLLRSGYSGMKEREAKIPASYISYRRAALERLVRLYETNGDTAQTAEWKQKLADFEQAEAAHKRAAKPATK